MLAAGINHPIAMVHQGTGATVVGVAQTVSAWWWHCLYRGRWFDSNLRQYVKLDVKRSNLAGNISIRLLYRSNTSFMSERRENMAHFTDVAQRDARGAHNSKVTGSTPVVGNHLFAHLNDIK